MEKIIKVALKGAFNLTEDQFNALMEVIMASGNPEVATEKLLGCFEEPDYPLKSKDKKSEVERTAVSYDAFRRRVNYSYKERSSLTKVGDSEYSYYRSSLGISESDYNNLPKREVISEKLRYSWEDLDQWCIE